MELKWCVLRLKFGVKRLRLEPRGWDMGLQAGILALRLGFGPQGWGMGFLEYQLQGWDLGLEAGL